MTATQKLKIAMIQLNINQLELARRTELSQPNLSRKMNHGVYTIDDYEKLVEALGCKLEYHIILPDGTRI